MEARISLDSTRTAQRRSGNCRRWVAYALTAIAAGLLIVGCAPPSERAAPVRPKPYIYHPPSQPVTPAYVPPKPAPSPVRACENTVTLGASKESHPIEMVIFGQDGETMLILGGIHGNEPTSADLARQLIRYLRANPRDYQGRRVAIAPAVNPDGLARGTRQNANGVDLNRNFPANNFPKDPGPNFVGGPYPVSEHETLAILAAVRQIQPAKIISIHSIRRGEHGNNYDGPSRALAAEMSRHNGYPLLSSMGYPTPGSFGSWAGVDRQIPTITLELPRDADPDTCWRENREALLAAIRFPVGDEPTQVADPVKSHGPGVGK